MADIHEIRRTLGLSMLVPVLNGAAGRWEPVFPSGEIVSEPRPVVVGPLGVTLQVPDRHTAVLTGGPGTFQVGQGFHYLDLPMGYYAARCVQMFQQPTRLAPVVEFAQDGLEVTLKVRLTWRVIDPLAVWDKPGFHQLLHETCTAAAANYIRSQPYARLVQTPGGPAALAPGEIAGALRRSILLSRAFNGLALLDVIVEPPQGVRELQETAQHAQVEASLLAAEDQLLERRTLLETRKARAERLVLAQQQRNRLVETGMDVQVAAMRRPILDQELEYQDLRNQVELRAEGGRLVLEARKEVLLRLADTLTNSLMAPNLLGQVGGMSSGVVAEMVRSVLDGLDPSMLALGDGSRADQAAEANPVTLRLVREIAEVELRLPGVEWQGLLAQANGEKLVQFAYRGWIIKLYANEEYPRRGPRVFIHRSSARNPVESKANTFHPTWNTRKRLVDLLVYLTNHIDNPSAKAKRSGDEGPFDVPPTYAG
jgi:hypothetical protein